MTVSLVRRQVDANQGGELSSQTDFFQSRNYLINSNFDIWQRGTSFTTPASGLYQADRFGHVYDGSGSAFVISQQAFTAGSTAPVPNEPTFFNRINVTTAGTGGSTRYHHQGIEGVRSLAGKTVSYSFWAKADAARNVTINFVQNFGTGGSPSTSVTTPGSTHSLTTTFQQFTGSVTLPSISGKTLGSNGNDFLDFQIALPINTLMTIDIAQIMVNEGTTVGPWRTAGNGMGHELQLCQRFYQTSGVGTTGFVDGVTTTIEFSGRLTTPMRAAPTGSLLGTNVSVIGYPSGGQNHFVANPASMGVGGTSAFAFWRYSLNNFTAGLSAGNGVMIEQNGGTTIEVFGWNAEF